MNTRFFSIAIVVFSILFLFSGCGGDDNGEQTEDTATGCPNENQQPVFVNAEEPFQFNNAEWAGEDGTGLFTGNFLFSSYPARVTVRFFRLTYYQGEPEVREMVDPSNHTTEDGSLRAVEFSASEVVELGQGGVNLYVQLETDYLDPCFDSTAQNFQFLVGPSGSVTYMGEVAVFGSSLGVEDGEENPTAGEEPEAYNFAARFDLCFEGVQLSTDPDAAMVADAVSWTPAGECWHEVTFQDASSALYLEFESSTGSLEISDLLLTSGLRLIVTDAASYDEIVPQINDGVRTYQLASRQVWFEITQQ